jgi:hypothetical protein
LKAPKPTPGIGGTKPPPWLIELRELRGGGGPGGATGAVRRGVLVCRGGAHHVVA